MSAFYQMFPCRLHRVNILMIMLLFCTWGQDVNAKFMTHLSNGLEFPLIGLGTGGQLKENTIKSALQIGYKLIDSGQVDAWYLEDEVNWIILLTSLKLLIDALADSMTF